MQIQSANVSLSSHHQFEKSEQQNSITLTRNTLTQNNVPTLPITTLASPPANQLPGPETISSPDIQTNLLKALVEAMIGKKIETTQFAPSENTELPEISAQAISTQTSTSSLLTPESAPNNQQSHFLTLNTTLTREFEHSEVSITAQLIDDNDTQLDIHLHIEMERFYQESNLDVLRQEGVITDPLTINFNGDTAKLSPQSVSFDLDSDGSLDLIPNLVSDSAYIALDKNNDGVINNGSELFGPTTGNGFDELAQYDLDKNGFIDNKDAVYSKLITFNPNTEHTQSLNSLGISALYLGSIESPFSLTDSNNNSLGQVRSTGFYVNANGSAGSLQQIDLKI